MNIDDVIKDITVWINKMIESKKFCDVSVNISVHAGKVSKIQKSLTEKYQ